MDSGASAGEQPTLVKITKTKINHDGHDGHDEHDDVSLFTHGGHEVFLVRSIFVSVAIVVVSVFFVGVVIVVVNVCS